VSIEELKTQRDRLVSMLWPDAQTRECLDKIAMIDRQIGATEYQQSEIGESEREYDLCCQEG